MLYYCICVIYLILFVIKEATATINSVSGTSSTEKEDIYSNIKYLSNAKDELPLEDANLFALLATPIPGFVPNLLEETKASNLLEKDVYCSLL